MARPSKYTQAKADAVCEAIATTPRGLDWICGNNEEFPTARTVHRWLVENETFRQNYTHARARQADLLFEECLEIADNAAQDTISFTKGGENGIEVEMPDKEWILRSKLRVETRLRMAGKLNPKKYGDKIQHDASDELKDTLTAFLGGIRSGK